MAFFKEPKNSENISWTKHAKEKMRYYQLSESHLKRVLRNPKRIEKGIAPNTNAIMQPAGTKKHPTEIWLMYQIKKSKLKTKSLKVIKIISAWRYPGVSPIREPPPIPEDVLKDLKEYGY
ncbi:MAG: hypothetical protein AUJ24_00890 [Parcubacteria group bacterium CG1_02_36_42]|nr:MAG: hypothetical protein AUJ24_00890 [Parcubacteria group bacterium CG1_02_36_42]